MIAFLGTGIMGTEFIRAFLARGESVTAWNRTYGRAEPLVADGATVVRNVEDAVRDVDRVHLSLLDDAAVDEVLERAVPAMRQGTVIIDHTTTATHTTVERAKRLAAQNIAFLHAPVFMGPTNARNTTGLMLVSGPRPLFERVLPTLEPMTGKVRYMGERADRAAAFKLFGNMLIMFIGSGLSEMFALARALEIDPRDAHTLFDDFEPSGQIKGRGKRMAAGEFSPAQFELSAARKDVRLMLDSATTAGATLHVLPSIAQRFDELIAAGLGHFDMAVIASPDVP